MVEDQGQSPMRFAGLGAELAGAILAGTLLGWAFDRWRDSDPWGLVIGATLGLIGGFYNFIKAAMKASKE